jgi:hypothetical protein
MGPLRRGVGRVRDAKKLLIGHELTTEVERLTSGGVVVVDGLGTSVG